ncbi:MAG: hypothetical protein LH654_03285 [Thermoleophilia bacterium]|nr:hypothetical protein [Thermoleophilia bacterium]
MSTNRKDRRWRGGVVVALAIGVAAIVAASAVGASQAAPVNTTAPTVSGTPKVGQTLTAGDGTWSNTPTSYAYQWLRCNGGGNSCVNVANGTQKTYTLVGVDSGNTMRVRVTATNADGPASAQSDQTAAVQAAASAAAPKNTSLPTISGTPKVAQVLTADNGTWTGSPTAYSYAWQRCDADIVSCTNLVGATGKTYAVRIDDLGYRLRVSVTARNAKGAGTVTSTITAIVAPAVRITNGRPTIKIISIRFSGRTVYARVRICDDSYKNLTILATDSRPGVAPYTRRFTTLVAPKPCGVYTRHWIPVARFRGNGTYTVTLKARDKSGLTSLPARRTFSR